MKPGKRSRDPRNNSIRSLPSTRSPAHTSGSGHWNSRSALVDDTSSFNEPVNKRYGLRPRSPAPVFDQPSDVTTSFKEPAEIMEPGEYKRSRDPRNDSIRSLPSNRSPSRNGQWNSRSAVKDDTSAFNEPANKRCCPRSPAPVFEDPPSSFTNPVNKRYCSPAPDFNDPPPSDKPSSFKEPVNKRYCPRSPAPVFNHPSSSDDTTSFNEPAEKPISYGPSTNLVIVPKFFDMQGAMNYSSEIDVALQDGEVLAKFYYYYKRLSIEDYGEVARDNILMALKRCCTDVRILKSSFESQLQQINELKRQNYDLLKANAEALKEIVEKNAVIKEFKKGGDMGKQ